MEKTIKYNIPNIAIAFKDIYEINRSRVVLHYYLHQSINIHTDGAQVYLIDRN
jgi:uncharacterized protein YdeI (YjbR/CyaY-like superfamily)